MPRNSCSSESNSACSSECNSVKRPVPNSSPAVLKCRSRTCRHRSRALSRSPLPAAAAIASSVSVTLDMALTTTYGCSANRPLTMPAMRSIAVASSTEVPPNFITITVLPPSRLLESRRASRQVALYFEEFGVQQRSAGRAANRVVREHRELVIKDATGTKTPDADRHPATTVEIEAWLWTVRGRVVHQRPFGSQWASQFVRFRFEVTDGGQDGLDISLLFQLHRHRLGVSVFHRDAIAMRCHAEAGILHVIAVQLAEEFLRLLLHLFFFFRNVWDHIAQNVERRNAGIARPADRLHGRHEERFHAKRLVQRRESDDQADRRTIRIGHDESARLLAPALLLDQREMVGIDLRNHQRHVLLHPKSARVADYGASCLGEFRLQLSRNTRVQCGENHAGSALRLGRRN